MQRAGRFWTAGIGFWPEKWHALAALLVLYPVLVVTALLEQRLASTFGQLLESRMARPAHSVQRVHRWRV